MVRTLGLFIGAGLAWLFLFSIPIGHGKTLYQVGQHYIIKTAPIQWIASKITSSYEATLEATEEQAAQFRFKELPDQFSQR